MQEVLAIMVAMNTANHTTKNPAIADAIGHFRSMTEMACALGLSGHQVIQDWVRRGVVPAEHCPKVEKLTGVPSEKLNSRVDWDFYRQSNRAPADNQEAA